MEILPNRFMKPKLLLAVLCCFTICAMLGGLVLSRKSQGPRTHARVFQVRGEIRALELADKTIRIAHDEIPGYMPAMTMPLAVKDLSLLKNLSAGDSVAFELSVTDNDSWISRITKIEPEGPAKVAAASSDSTATADTSGELRKGELVPDFDLVDQNGKSLRLSNFHGKMVVLTFIYTRCPLPNFCPLMSKNFESLQQRLQKAFPGKFQLLSVSIDPRFDRPEVLKDYATRYNADEKSWSFATGSEDQINFVASLFGLVHEPESGLIPHNLRTALISPDGHLLHLWKSNVWTPFEVQRMIGDELPDLKGVAAR